MAFTRGVHVSQLIYSLWYAEACTYHDRGLSDLSIKITRRLGTTKPKKSTK